MINSKLQTSADSKIRNPKFWVLFAICLLSFVVFPFSALALEVQFPEVQGVKVGESMGPAEWIKYIFLLAQALVGLAIIYAFVRAGLLWMTGGDNPGNIKEAKERMLSAIIGLVILLGSYLFLQTINPQLVNIKNPGVNFGTDAPSGMFDFWAKLFTTKRAAGEACGSSFDCGGFLTCVKTGKSSSGICTDTGELFNGFEAGHACTKDYECGRDLTCDDTKNICVAGTKTAGGSTCFPAQCPEGQRCFKTSSGELAENISGECSSYKALGENCRTDISNECRGIGTECDLATKKCIQKENRVNPSQNPTPPESELGSGLNTEQIEILTTGTRILSDIGTGPLSLKTETEWLDMLQVLLQKNLTEEEKNKGKQLYNKLKQGALSTDDLKLGLKEIFYPGK
ncbi:MAG: hypothetical protein Q8Q90_02125 [bacterium]|nr:hypothetical protein [bacterium]